MTYDLLVIGGGINGCGIARDAAGRGLSVALIEAGDIGGATSSASTKLIHGGLRYLEFYEFGLVRKALAEREVLLDIAPHIAWPLPFVLPYEAHLRPAWMIRAGLFLYDRLAKRRQIPGSERVSLRQDRAGGALSPKFANGFRYWDAWVDDARLVVLNAMDAARLGARISPRTMVAAARFDGALWHATLNNGETLQARFIVNAAGPWAGIVAAQVMGQRDAPRLRLVQGSHIVTRRVNHSADAYILQQPDGRIVFIIPYERDFSLIGTTETPVEGDPGTARPTDEEALYLLEAANRYLARPIGPGDIVRRFTGVRPLVLEEGKGARETTRDWQFVEHADAPALTIVGGKITTYRVLAEAALALIAPDSTHWTASVPLPGGDVQRERGETGQDAFARWLRRLIAEHHDFDPALLTRMARLYGTGAESLITAGLGRNIGGIFEAELDYLVREEWARTAEDVLWRRTKLGLHMLPADRAAVESWFGRRG